jgi:hypothetical protein
MMNSAIASIVLSGLVVLPHLGAQPPAKRVSPHETITTTLNGKQVKIEYGRPYLKGRSLESLAPGDKVWRLGADEATKLTTETDLRIGDLKVPKGSYALFAIPMESKWTLIVNKTADQWGAFSYDAAQDLGRVDLRVGKTSAPVEQFTMALDGSGKETNLKLMWGSVAANVSVTVE